MGLTPVVKLHAGQQAGHEGGDELHHLVVLFLAVDDQVVHLAGEQIAHRPQAHRQDPGAAKGTEARRRRWPMESHRERKKSISAASFWRLGPLAHRAGDKAHALGAQFFDEPAQALALLRVFDAPAHPHMVDGGHEHQVAAGQGHMAGDAGALVAQGLLGHLHHDLLALAQHLLDAAAGAALGLGGHLAGVPLHLFRGLVHVAYVKEGGLGQADVHKGGLHAGQHPGHPAQIHVARQGHLLVALHVDFHALAVFQQGHAGFIGARVYEQSGGHQP